MAREVIEVVPAKDGWPDGIHDLLGTEHVNGRASRDHDGRKGRCFELAGHAVALGHTTPTTRLVHGSMRAPAREGATERRRIAHAWVELPVPGLPNLLIWEPVMAVLYDAAAIREFLEMWDERTYSQASVRQLIGRSKHYGPWHEPRYPALPKGEEAE